MPLLHETPPSPDSSLQAVCRLIDALNNAVFWGDMDEIRRNTLRLRAWAFGAIAAEGKAPDAKRPQGPWVLVKDERPPQSGIYVVLFEDGTVGKALFVPSPLENWRTLDANGDMAPAGTRHARVEAWSRTR